MLREDFTNKFDPAISTIPDSKPYIGIQDLQRI